MDRSPAIPVLVLLLLLAAFSGCTAAGEKDTIIVCGRLNRQDGETYSLDG
jgi:hypothetical protein